MSIFWTVSQSQAEPTSAGSTHTAILIPRERPAGPIKIFWETGREPGLRVRLLASGGRSRRDVVGEPRDLLDEVVQVGRDGFDDELVYAGAPWSSTGDMSQLIAPCVIGADPSSR